MNKMQCEVCGGNNLIKTDDNVFECQSCGCKYTLEQAKKMINVQVDGIASIENLLMRANKFMEDGNFTKASEYFERVLDLDIINEEAILGLDKAKEKATIRIGQIYEAKVIRIMSFGAFVKFNNVEGLIHISKLSEERIEKPEDVVSVGDNIIVKIIEIDSMGRINLSAKPSDINQ